MAYLEFLRIRRRIVILGAILAFFAVVIVVSSGHANIEIDGSHKTLDSVIHPIPLSLLLGLAGFITAGMGAFLASLNSMSDTLPSVWTKPVPRERMALTIFSVDALGLVACYALALAAGLITLAGLGLLGKLFVDSQAAGIAVLGLGTTLMAYGNVQALTAWHLNRGGMIAGVAWGSYFVLIVLSIAPLAPALHAIVSTLDILNPLAYYGSINTHGSEVTNVAMFGYGMWTRAAIVFAFGIVGCAIATFGWKRMEI